ncbi:23S rRNA (adenine(2503)-C(2))-methyltransferase RlmN [Longimonas halophila]|uniref:Probable dual-specificity RNA methyltransferase RlmN n=1 Tax=Longimonas halophila TaxID=1469170 RepID=A0A2H3NMB1_9BACT|nr:23S rRNA (adenine(2503)-C(2))-methyltransferase RlmN [Longimonas halophila]PEN07664.1 23S rRNA (adenine(2503)-C(2))-methyltransferase RlmN [Longimonas halophila]
MADRVDLKTMGRTDLESFVETLDEPSYRGRQLYNWIYARGETDFAEMTSLSKSLRSRLGEVAQVSSITVKRMQQSDDGTSKALFTLPSRREAETVLIPSFDALGTAQRLTVCVSSQVGCAMGCSFCATGLMGFQENLSPGAIYDQVWVMNQEAQERYGRAVSNVVFMGMGEPLLNYDAVLQSVALLTDEDTLNMSPRRITISTVGLARRIRDLADDDPRTNLAVSLHAPTDEQRSAIMPVNQSEKTSLDALEAAIRYYADTTGRPITYEYCLFEGVNDAVEDAKNLAEITRWAPSKVNILMYNPVPSLPFERTTTEQLNRFVQALVEEGVTVTVRQSRGQDIDAACGQLANA